MLERRDARQAVHYKDYRTDAVAPPAKTMTLERGRSGVFVQDFDPDRDTTATRRAVAGFSRDSVTESLGVSPDGSRVTISALEQSRVLMVAEGLEGIAPRARFGR